MKQFLSFAVGLITFCIYSIPTTALAGPLPIDNWAIREVIQGVEVSPNGQKMALLRNDSRDGNPIVEIYDTSDLSKEPTRFNSTKMELTSLSWISDEYLLFGARKQYYNRIQGFNRGTYKSLAATYNIKS